MQKVKIFIQFLLCLAIAVNCHGKVSDDHEKQLLDRLSGKLINAIKNNAEHTTSKGKQYLIVDDENGDHFFPWFTSDQAGKMWFGNYTSYANAYHDVTLRDINDQIIELKETYLDPTKFKDYDIYFVVSGIYYARNIEDTKKEQELNWEKLKLRSFDNEIKQELPGTGSITGNAETYISGLTEKLLEKVKTGVDKEMVNYSHLDYKKDGKILIIFKWVLFDISNKDAYGNELTLNSNASLAENITKLLSAHQEFSMHVIDGIRYYTKYESDITGLMNFLSRGSSGDVDDYDHLLTRNSKLMKDVTNTFLYFYQQENGNVLKDFCNAPDQSGVIEKIAKIYAIPAEGRAMRNPTAFLDLSFTDRKCLLDYLLQKKFCTDIKGYAIPANGCENVILDVIEGTPPAQRKAVLDYFNTPVNYYRLYKAMDDTGGDDNHTEIVFLLANMAQSLQYGGEAGPGSFEFKWYKKEYGSHRVKIVSEVTADIDTDKGIQFKVTQGFKTRWRNLQPFNFDPCSPFTPVKLAITDQISYISKIDGTPVTVGETITVPALFLHWVIRNEFKRELANTTKNLVLTAALFTGIGELSSASSLAARIWAGADVFFTTSAMITGNEDVRKYVQQKWGEDGIAALDAVDDLGTFVGVAYLTKGVVSSIDNVVQNATTKRIIREMAEDARMRQQTQNSIEEVSKLLNRLEIEDELFIQIKNSLAERIGRESQNFTMKYTDVDIRRLIANGKKLDLPDREIEDIIFNGCRNEKNFGIEDLLSQSNFWGIVRKRGFPNLFDGLGEYEKFSEILKKLAREWNLPENYIFVQGSTLKVSDAKGISDIDVAIKVDAATFDKLVERFRETTTVQGKAKNILRDARKGKISAALMYLNLETTATFKAQFWKAFETDVVTAPMAQRLKGVSIDFQISIIKINGTLDVSPYLKLK